MPAATNTLPRPEYYDPFPAWEAQFSTMPSHDVAEDPYFAVQEAKFSRRDEERKSFDPLASVRMFRYDLDHFGHILPETRDRVRDEELSLISEGLNRAARTTFALERQGDDLMYFKHGKWCSYTGMLIEGARVAKAEALEDPRREFLAEDAINDLRNLYQMRKLQPGQQHVWYSRYRQDVEDSYGADFMQECGRFPARQMGFIHRAYRNDAGNVILESQTVDHSPQAAFDAVMRTAEDGTADMDALVAAHDETIGDDVYAGRGNAEIKENIWATMLTHTDLIQFFLNKLEAIAATPLQAEALEVATKRHIYGVWAAFKQRIDGLMPALNYQVAQASLPVAHLAMLEREVHQAFTQFAAEGRPMLGCGGIIEVLKGEENILKAAAKTVFESIFGGEIGKAGKTEVLKCVTCPLCKKAGVDATVVHKPEGGKTIKCSSCKKQKTYSN